MTTLFAITIVFPSTSPYTPLKTPLNLLTLILLVTKFWRDSLKKIYNKAKSHLIRSKLRKLLVTSATDGFSLSFSLNNLIMKVENQSIARMTSILTKLDLLSLKRLLLRPRSLKKAKRDLKKEVTAKMIPKNNPMKR